MTEPLSTAALSAIRARCEAATEGPWRWRLSLKSKQVVLESAQQSRINETVVDFVRWGMSGASPRLNVGGIMRNASDFAVPVQGREHHAAWLQSIGHPDAAFIEHARADVAALLGEVDRLTKLLPGGAA
jgi:hypothetical protein